MSWLYTQAARLASRDITWAGVQSSVNYLMIERRFGTSQRKTHSHFERAILRTIKWLQVLLLLWEHALLSLEKQS